LEVGLCRLSVICCKCPGTNLVLVLVLKLTPTASDIKTEQMEAISEFPRAIEYNEEEIDNPAMDIGIVFRKMVIKMDCLQNDFFLERLCLRQSQPDAGDLLAISFELVALTISLWTRIDRFTKNRPDFEWLVRQYQPPAL
jgi:hypothetical protein